MVAAAGRPRPAGARVPIRLVPSESWFITGKRGSGKTHLARYLLHSVSARHWPVVIVDPKRFWMGRRPQWAPGNDPGTVDRPRLVTRFDPRLAVQLYQPATDHAWDDAGLDKLCFDILRHGRNKGGLFVYFDELENVANIHHSPGGFTALWTQGRAIDVSAICGSQRPKRIPEEVKSQSDNWAVFRLPNEDDRKHVAGYVQIPVHELLPRRWWRYAHLDTMDEAVLMRPVEGEPAVPGGDRYGEH